MIFKKLILKNFKSHINTTIDFNKGTTIILGENGAGKSSIFEGINFALYKKYNTKSLNDLINNQSNSMAVTLHFLIGNKEYKITRTRNQSKSTADLYVLHDDEFIQIVSGDKEVNNHIEELLEIDADLFLNAIYIKQGEIDSLVTQKSSERKKNISKLLRLENLEVSYKNLANVISNYELKRNQIKSLIDNTFQNNKNELIQEQDELQNQLDVKNKELLSLQESIKDVKAKINEQNAHNVTYQQLNNKRTQLNTEAQVLSNNIDDLEKQIVELKESQQLLISLKNDINNIDLIKELSGYLDEKNELLSDINSIENNIKNNLEQISFIYNIADVYQSNINKDSLLIEQIIELEDLINTDCLENKKAIHNTQEQVKQIIVEITKLKTIISDNRQLLQDVENVQGICPICQSILDDEHKSKLINNYNNIIQDNSLKLNKMEIELDVLQKEENSLNEMLKEKRDFLAKTQNAEIIAKLIDDNIKQKTNVQMSLNNIEEKINNSVKLLHIDNYDEYDIQTLYHDLLEKQQKYQEAEFNIKNKHNIQKKYDAVKIKYHQVITDLEDIDNKILYLNFDVNILQQYQTQQSELQNQYYPLVKEIGQIENTIKYNNTQIDTIDDKIKQNSINQDKVQKLDEFIAFLKDIRELYSKDGLQKTIRLSFRPQIQKYTQEFFAKFGFDYSNLSITDDYDILISGSSGDSNVNMISGGEKIAVALALRLGIAQAITANKIETILLDEPTTYLDEYRKQEFVQIIQNISLVPQLIIITHDSELINAASTVISVEKSNGKSVIV